MVLGIENGIEMSKSRRLDRLKDEKGFRRSDRETRSFEALDERILSEIR
jgi:hypothetical protein